MLLQLTWQLPNSSRSISILYTFGGAKISGGCERYGGWEVRHTPGGVVMNFYAGAPFVARETSMALQNVP